MTLLRMDHVSVVVDDLAAATAFFAELGMENEAQMPIEGEWVDRINAINGLRVEIVMMSTPDGSGKLELTKFYSPAAIAVQPPNNTPNALGIRSVMFEVDDIDDAVMRLQKHGAQLVGEISQYENIYRLCYLTGPAGMIVALAENIS